MQDHEDTNHCGPDGDDPVSRSISWAISDTIFGVYIGKCCEEHDYSWGEGANKSGDEDFKDCIRCEFKKKFKNHRVSLFVSAVAYLVVRVGSGFYKLLGK